MELFEHAGYVASLFGGDNNSTPKLVPDVFRQYWDDQEREDIRKAFVARQAVKAAEKALIMQELKAAGEEIEL